MLTHLVISDQFANGFRHARGCHNSLVQRTHPGPYPLPRESCSAPVLRPAGILELVPGHFRPKDLDLCGVTNMRDDLVVIFAEMIPETPVVYIHPRAISGDNRGVRDIRFNSRSDYASASILSAMLTMTAFLRSVHKPTLLCIGFLHFCYQSAGLNQAWLSNNACSVLISPFPWYIHSVSEGYLWIAPGRAPRGQVDRCGVYSTS